MMDTIRRLFVGFALAGATSCSSLPGKPPVEPTPPPPEPQCAEGQTHSCWHFPPDSRTWLYACPVYDDSGAVLGVVNVVGGPAQCPSKPSEPPPPPTGCAEVCPPESHCEGTACVPDAPPPATDCSPVLNPALSAPSNDDSNWATAADQSIPSDWKNAVWDSVSKAKQACPSAWSGDCMAGGPSKIDYGYLLISKELQKKSMRASQATTSSGEKADHLWIQRASSSKDWNATKLFFYGNGCLITGDGAFTVHGWYTFVGGDPTPPPVDPPPSSGACTAPLPPKVWTIETLPDGWGSDEIGQPRWELGCVPHGNVVDCTPKVAPRACDYCAAIGMGEAGGQPRCGCPVRNECPGYKCDERAACEAYLTGGTKLESKNGAACEFAHGNPLQFYPNQGNCRLCSVGDPRVCGGWF